MKEEKEADRFMKSWGNGMNKKEGGAPKTIRQEIAGFLRETPMSALEISRTIGIREKTVYDHLPHIARSAEAQGKCFVISPARCLRCGYRFGKRHRVKSPSRCPKCKGTHIQDPSFEIQS